MKSLLIFPPGWSPVSPYLALPILKAYVEDHTHFKVSIADWNVLFYDWYFSTEHVRDALATSRLNECPSMSENLTVSLVKDTALLVDEAKEIFRSKNFFNLDNRRRAENIFRDAIYVLDAVHPDMKCTFNNIVFNNYSHYSSQSVMKAAEDDVNPIAKFYREHCIDSINSARYEFIGISVSGAYQLIPTFILARQIKMHCPSVRHISLGGNYITRLADYHQDRILKFFKYIDSIMCYEGEVPLCQLLDAVDKRQTLASVQSLMYVNDGQAEKTPLAPSVLNGVTPNFEGFALDKYMMPELVLPIYSSRQCFNNCAFCTIPQATNGRYRTLPVKRVVDIMDELHDKYGSRVFSFVDETFEAHRLQEFSNELLKRGRTYFWHGETRFSPYLTFEVCCELERSGCRQLQFGLESYNQRVLDLMQKGIKVSWIDTCISNCLRAGIPVHLFFMTGFPTETRAEALRTIKYTERVLLESRERYGVPYSTRGFDAFGLDIGSDVWLHPKKYGITPILNDDNFDIRLNVRYKSANGLSMSEASHLVKSHHIEYYADTLIANRFAFHLPERIHISEVTWILDSAYKVAEVASASIVAPCPSSIPLHETYCLNCYVTCVITDAFIFLYNRDQHVVCQVDTRSFSISGDKRYISPIKTCNAANEQQAILSILIHYGFVEYAAPRVSGNELMRQRFCLNPFIERFSEQDGRSVLLVSGISQKLSRVGRSVETLLNWCKIPITLSELYSKVKDGEMHISFNQLQELISVTLQGDLIYPVSNYRVN